MSESLEYETKQRQRRLNRKRTEKMRSQQKSTSSTLQGNTNIDSPLDSITSFEQSGNCQLASDNHKSIEVKFN